MILKTYKTKNAALTKMRAMGFENSYGRIGFANFQIITHFPQFSEEEIANNPYITDKAEQEGNFCFAIEGYSNFHSDTTIRNMFNSNGKKW